MTAFVKEKIGSYWFGTGTPTYLIEMLHKYNIPPQRVGAQKASADDFDAPTERMTNIIPLLYQSGYLTIKDFDDITEQYTLDFPNKEVRVGLMKSLLPDYLHGYAVVEGKNTVGNMYKALLGGDMDGALRLLQAFLLTVPYTEHTAYEGHYQQMLYIIFSLLGYYVDVEVRTPRGRVDMVIRTATTLYVVELKLDKDAEIAMNQIDLKQYPERFALCGLPVVKVGINFDSERRTLGDWKIEV